MKRKHLPARFPLIFSADGITAISAYALMPSEADRQDRKSRKQDPAVVADDPGRRAAAGGRAPLRAS